jgi:hypothetical protein
MHAYGSWHPDHPDGWHQHGLATPLLPSENLGAHRRASQRWPTAEFSATLQPDLGEMARDICNRRQWRCHAVAINETHIHIVTSWRAPPEDPLELQHTFKRLLGWKLAKLTNIQGRRWISDGGRPKPVADLEHLQYLLTEYLPDQGGHFWREPKNLPLP